MKTHNFLMLVIIANIILCLVKVIFGFETAVIVALSLIMSLLFIVPIKK